MRIASRWINKITVFNDFDVAIAHRWDMSMDSGEMIPVYHGDVYVEEIITCMCCGMFHTHFLRMLWSEVYNAN